MKTNNNTGKIESSAALRILPVLMLLCIGLVIPEQLSAQSCDSTVPSYTINMTGSDDSVWTSASVSRQGHCCSASGSDRCIYFEVTLDLNAGAIQVDISGGTGSTFYEVNCLNSTATGNAVCVVGTGPHKITVCKPGGNAHQYTITSIPRPRINVNTIYSTVGCSTRLIVSGMVDSTIQWTSLTGSAYSSSLTCSTGCDTTYITPGTNWPSYVDFQACGTPTNTCLLGTYCDTVRVYFVDNHRVTISPDTPYICYGDLNTTLTANVTGGKAPYTYLWSTGATTQSISSTAGTRWVRVRDSLGCISDYDTITVAALPQVTVNAGNDTSVCTNRDTAQLNGSISGIAAAQWSGGSGTFLPDDTTPDAIYIPGAADIAAGSVRLRLTALNSGNCGPYSDSVDITILQAPVPDISGSDTACTNSGIHPYTTANNAGSIYSWSVSNGTILSGGNTPTAIVRWGSVGAGVIYVTETKTNGCSETDSYNISVKPRPATDPIQH